MPKLGMEPLRRRQIIDAAIACIHQDGIGKASMQRIARRAGITAGLIVHYFNDKDGLWEAVYRDLYTRLNEATRIRRLAARNPIERVLAIAEAQVCPEMLEPQTIVAWFAICAKLPETPMIARLEKINARRFNSNMIFALKQAGLPQDDAQQVADELRAITYGLWLNLANSVDMTEERARAILFGYLDGRLPALCAPARFKSAAGG